MTFSERLRQMNVAELAELADRKMDGEERLFVAICTGISIATIVMLVWIARVPALDTDVSKGAPHEKIFTQR